MEVTIKSEKRRRLTQIFNALRKEWCRTPAHTQKRLAKQIQATSGFITHVKNGLEWFSLEKLELVCQVFDIPCAYFELADERLTVAENKKIVNLLMELRDSLVDAALSKR